MGPLWPNIGPKKDCRKQYESICDNEIPDCSTLLCRLKLSVPQSDASVLLIHLVGIQTKSSKRREYLLLIIQQLNCLKVFCFLYCLHNYSVITLNDLLTSLCIYLKVSEGSLFIFNSPACLWSNIHPHLNANCWRAHFLATTSGAVK